MDEFFESLLELGCSPLIVSRSGYEYHCEFDGVELGGPGYRLCLTGVGDTPTKAMENYKRRVENMLEDEYLIIENAQLYVLNDENPQGRFRCINKEEWIWTSA